MSGMLSGPLQLWRVFMESGETIEVAAHADKIGGGWLVFVIFVGDDPRREVPVAAFPDLAVADWDGGEVFDGRLPTADSIERMQDN